MVEEKKRFALYEYLLYFWKKKMVFLMVTLVTTILVVGAVYAIKHTHNRYTGVAWIFTGSVNAKDLTDPENISAKYKDMKTLSDVTVTEKGQVKLTVNGNAKEQVQKDLDDITTSFNKELQDNANARLDETNSTVQDLEARIEDLKKSIRFYQAEMIQKPIAADRFSDLITTSEDNLSDAQTRVDEKKGDLVLFEKPKVLSENVGPKKTYLPESIAIGIILGILFAIALLMLMKYMEDARKYYRRT